MTNYSTITTEELTAYADRLSFKSESIRANILKELDVFEATCKELMAINEELRARKNYG